MHLKRAIENLLLLGGGGKRLDFSKFEIKKAEGSWSCDILTIRV